MLTVIGFFVAVFAGLALIGWTTGQFLPSWARLGVAVVLLLVGTYGVGRRRMREEDE